MAWGNGAGALAPSDWREMAAETDGSEPEQSTLFSAPLVAPRTPAKASPPARGVSEEQIERAKRAVEARGAEAARAWPPRRNACPTN